MYTIEEEKYNRRGSLPGESNTNLSEEHEITKMDLRVDCKSNLTPLVQTEEIQVSHGLFNRDE